MIDAHRNRLIDQDHGIKDHEAQDFIVLDFITFFHNVVAINTDKFLDTSTVWKSHFWYHYHQIRSYHRQNLLENADHVTVNFH